MRALPALLVLASVSSAYAQAPLLEPVPNLPGPALDFTPPPAEIAAPTPTLPPVINEDAFKQALASAYTNNPRIRAQREALKALDEGVATAVSGFRPSVVAGADVGRARSKSAGDWTSDNFNSHGVTVSQPLFNGGETLAQFKSAKARVKAGRADLHAMEQQVLYEAVDAYSLTRQNVAVVELNKNNVDVLKKQLEATNARFEVGELTRTDVAQAQARLANAEASLRQSMGDLEAAKATYLRVIGIAAPLDVPAPQALPDLPNSVEAAVEVAAASNPSLNAARFTEKAAGSAVNEGFSALLPDLSLDGNMSRGSGGSSSLGAGGRDSDSVTLNLSIPLYQSGAEYARIRGAKNLREQAKYNTIDTSQAVRELVTSAFENYQAAEAVILSNEAAIKASEVALEGVAQENEFGVRTILDVLDAEQELFTNRVNLVRAERTRILSAYRLSAAMGKLTAKDLVLPVDIYDPKEHYDDVKWLPIGF